MWRIPTTLSSRPNMAAPVINTEWRLCITLSTSRLWLFRENVLPTSEMNGTHPNILTLTHSHTHTLLDMPAEKQQTCCKLHTFVLNDALTLKIYYCCNNNSCENSILFCIVPWFVSLTKVAFSIPVRDSRSKQLEALCCLKKNTHYLWWKIFYKLIETLLNIIRCVSSE